MDIDNNTEVPEPTSVAPTQSSEEDFCSTTSTENNNMTVDTPSTTTEEIKAAPSPKDNDAMDIEKDDVPSANTDNKSPTPPPAAQPEDTTMDDVNYTNDESNNNKQPQPPTAMETTTATVPPKEEEELVVLKESSTKRVKPSVEETKPTPLQNKNNNIGKNDKVKEELVVVKEKELMKDVIVKNSNSSKVNLLADKKLGEDLDSALDRLLEVSCIIF